ncbi:DNA adenine methylase [Carnimonas bestiolae]|uniref:DNA adenine methylase n=1 Tax=Carnimonas bestiolae TaxID=3402172 RepID=UPI003EDC64AC
MSVPAPLLRYLGSKWRLAPFVIRHFPPTSAYDCYVEPFGGSAAVLLQKSRSYAEVYNDLDADVVNLFTVLRNKEHRARLMEATRLTPFARDEFNAAYVRCDDPVERARTMLVRAHMSFGAQGATYGDSGFRTDTRRAYSTAQHQWMRIPTLIEAVADRLAGVLIENRDAMSVMRQHDHLRTLHYVDPPYIHDTRIRCGQQRYYSHEMNLQQHAELLRGLDKLSGYVLLSGYDHELYHETLQHWHCVKTRSRISAGRGTGIRTECLWLNPRAAEWAGQMELDFQEAAHG